MKYPNLVDGASTNISVIAPASKATARGTVRGGRTTNDTATARPASASSATTIGCPVCGQACAITYPGSGLRAADVMPSSPSRNLIVFTTSARGRWKTNGPTQTTSTPTAATAKL